MTPIRPAGDSGKSVAWYIKERNKDTNIIYLSDDIILDTHCVKVLAEYIEQLEKENEELKLKNERLTDKYAKSLMGLSLKELLEKWDKE